MGAPWKVDWARIESLVRQSLTGWMLSEHRHRELEKASKKDPKAYKALSARVLREVEMERRRRMGW
jgi:hypothetical protein